MGLNATYTQEKAIYDKNLEKYEAQQEEIEEKKAEAEKDGGDYEIAEEDLL